MALLMFKQFRLASRTQFHPPSELPDKIYTGFISVEEDNKKSYLC